MKAPRAPIPRLRSFSGPAILAYGFRPFFFGAALAAVLGLVVWLAILTGALVLPSAFTPLSWHAHEMLFGFAVAAVAGFLLTAIPNWTGGLPLHGRPLLILVTLWLAGRLAVAISAVIGAWPAAAVDLAFLAALVFTVGREVVAGKNWRNLPMPVALLALLSANVLMHLEALELAPTATIGWRLGVCVVTVLIVLIGGRIVPSFTRNWLAKRGERVLPAPVGRFDLVAIAATVVALVGWIALPGSGLGAGLLALAGALNAVRLGRWCGHRTLADPLVFVLHIGYAWVAAGLALLAAAQVGLAGSGPLFDESAAIHGLTTGAFGTMILAVMTRATLGHTGRPLQVGTGTTLVYLLVSVAAVARIATAAWGGGYHVLLGTAAIAWIGAFSGFLVLYGPMLVRPRPDGKAG